VKKILILVLLSIISMMFAEDVLKYSDESVDFFFDVLQYRRSVRSYEDTPIPEEDLMKILQAGAWAPTSGNQQPWKFIVVQDSISEEKIKEETLKEVTEYFKIQDMSPDEIEERLEKHAEYLDSFLSAPVYIVVLTDDNSKWPSYNIHDGPLAAENIILAARALGYGTVYATDSISDSATRKALNIPEHYTRTCFIPLGIPKEWPEVHEKLDLNEFIVWEKFE